MSTIEPPTGWSPKLRTRPLFVISVEVGNLVDAGGPPGAQRRIANLKGGTFNGERLSGIVLGGGTDWQTLRGDNAVLIDARILLRTDDDASIAMTYLGVRHGPPEILAGLSRGETVDPESYYFRITPRFETSAPRYEWLNRVVAIGIGQRLPEGPVYHLLEVL